MNFFSRWLWGGEARCHQQKWSIYSLIGIALELWFASSPKNITIWQEIREYTWMAPYYDSPQLFPKSRNPNSNGSKIFVLQTSCNQPTDGNVFTLHNVLDIWHSPPFPIAKPMTLSISPPLPGPRHALAIFLEHRHLQDMVLPAVWQTSNCSGD